MELWNVRDLEPPPISSCKVFAKEVDIRLLNIALKEALVFFGNQKHLTQEAALLSRCIYRFKMKFRSSLDLKSVEKLLRVLRIYLRMDLLNLLENLSKSTPQNYRVSQIYLLTKNMMDYVLVRLQGLGKLLCRMLDICQDTSFLSQLRLRLGHFWKIALVIMAITARIFVIGRSILKFCCELYKKLLPFSKSLRNSGVRWLPHDYVLPTSLDEWLGIDWLALENKEIIEIRDDDPTISFWKLADSDEEVEFCDEYILVKDDTVMVISESENEEENVPAVDLVSDDLSEIDVGEEIDCNKTLKRLKKSPAVNKRKRKKNIKKRYFHSPVFKKLKRT